MSPLNYKIKSIVLSCSLLLFSACAEMDLNQALQTGLDIAAGSETNYAEAVKETLELSSTRASGQLSQAGGYSDNPLYRIAMPSSLEKVSSTLRTFGLNKQVDQVELLMNRGAEQAANEAKAVFINAVREMTVNDALGIIRGNETAATDYFKLKTEDTLRQRYLPIIQDNLGKVGFYNEYKGFLTIYNNLPVSNKPDLDLEQHVLNQALTGLFSQVAKEESLIRDDPIGRGNALLQKVFTQ